MPRLVVREFDKSILFPKGSAAYVTIPSAAALMPAVISVGCWVRVQYRQSQVWVSKWGGGGNASWQLQTDAAGTVTFKVYNGTSATTLTTVNILRDGMWYFVVGTRDASAITIYINGIAIATSASPVQPMTTSTGTVDFGRENTGNSYASGWLSQVRIWNVALTITQIRDLYFAGTIPTTGLVGTWLLSEGTGLTATDTTGGRNGTLTASPEWSDIVPMKARTAIT